MSEYFTLALAGAGSWEVEHLKSYFFRLADLHGVTQQQLMTHLCATFGRHKRNRPVPDYLLFTKSMAMASYGDNVERLVKMLESATGVENLRAATLLTIAPVASPNAAFALFPYRRWCPACYKEDRKQGLLYDRLIWCIRGIQRCPAHQYKLRDACPACSSRQHFYDRQPDISCCRKCGTDLTEPLSALDRQPNPSMAERDAQELVSFIATGRTVNYNEREILEFFWSSWRDYRLASRPHRSKHNGFDTWPVVRYGQQPTLMMMLSIAALAEVPLTLILDHPRIARRLLNTTLFYQDYVPQVRHFWHEERDHYRLHQRLEALCCDLELVRTCGLKRHLANDGYTVGMARYWYPELCARIAKVRKISLKRLREYHIYRIQAALIESGLLRNYRRGWISSFRDLVYIVGHCSQAPKSLVRRELKRIQSEPAAYKYFRSSKARSDLKLAEILIGLDAFPGHHHKGTRFREDIDVFDAYRAKLLPTNVNPGSSEKS